MPRSWWDDEFPAEYTQNPSTTVLPGGEDTRVSSNIQENYQRAIVEYTRGLGVASASHARAMLFANRALCNLKLRAPIP